ncbi:MAG: transglycosylase SLT domain-containing protein [Deltaproteobacteria bacterium]|nr:transglycosylase SLT domain-containing protein [Deltaproteobacteria bacterium]
MAPDDPSPSLIASLQLARPQSFCGEPVPMKQMEVKERFEKEFLLSLWDRPQVLLWLKRSTRYLPIVEKLLQENGLPDDLKYVAIAESALRPHVRSRKGAVGFWQFMKGTGRRYGLTINRYMDERRSLVASTQAAIRYFKDLHEEFGSWTLAAAAYNMGEKGLADEILEQQTRDYYQLYLPLETQRFLFRILSVKLILSEPERFGFALKTSETYPPLLSDKVTVTSRGNVPIRVVAQAAKTRFKVIKDFNPELRGYHLGPGLHEIRVPKGASEGFRKRYNRLLKESSRNRNKRGYVVRKGDNLSSIAEKFNVPLAALIIWNRIDPKRPIHPGDRIIVYPGK